MATATEECASICTQLSAISIAPKHNDRAAAPELASSLKKISRKKNDEEQKAIAAGDISSPRNSWKNPTEIPFSLEHGDAAYFEEPISSWPLPSCDGINKKKQAHGRRQEDLSNCDGDHLAILPPADLREIQQNQIEISETFLPPSNISRAVHPPLLPAPRQPRERTPARNPRRGRNQNHPHFPLNLNHHQHQRPRHPSKTHYPSHQPPNHAITTSFYHPMDHPVTNFPNFSPDWGFNPVPNPQWTSNPLPPASYFINPAPSQETMLLYSYLPGPPFIEGFPYPAPPISPITPPPFWNQPVLASSLPPPGKGAFQEPLEIHRPQDLDVDVKLRQQIEYYFSDENLMKDGYLKKCMDDHGWISVHTIAKFRRVQVLTNDVDLIVAALQNSATVEVSGSKMRRRGEWTKWILQHGPTAVNDQH